VRVALLVVSLVPACNQLYGLDPTRIEDAFEPFDDVDQDSIPDARDNCPTVANADQRDDDADGKGDACDGCAFCMPCARGPDHDEDGDKLADGCDNCPAYDNPSQENADGDDLGDACDPSGAVHRRRLFDGFATLSPEWLQKGAPWGVVDDELSPMPGFGIGIYELLHATLKIDSGSTWFVEIGIQPPPNSDLGVSLTAGTPTAPLFTCYVVPGNGVSMRLSNSGIVDPTGFPFTTFGRMRFGVTAGLTGQRPVCELLGVYSFTHPSEFVIEYPLGISFYAASKARFTYIDVIGP